MPVPEAMPTHRCLTADSLGARLEQQDAALAFESAELGTALLLVSDGVGGNSGGRIASQTVAEMTRKLWEERKGDLSDAYADLALLCRVAHQKINEEGEKRGITPRATVVVLYLTPTQAHWAHSGDSRLYHFRGGELVERTEDHSLIQVLVNQGMVKDQEMGRHPDQGTLLQSLGGDEYKEPTQGRADIGPEDGFVLCTDGFWERITTEEMAALIQCPPDQAQRNLQAVVETAVKRNGSKSDNVTVAIALTAASAAAAASTPSPLSFPEAPAHAPVARGGRPALIALTAMALLLGLVAAFFLWNYLNKPITPTTPPQSSILAPDASATGQMPAAAPPRSADLDSSTAQSPASPK